MYRMTNSHVTQPTPGLHCLCVCARAGGLEPSRDGPQAKSSFDAHVTGLFFPIDLDTPGLRVLNIDPPVLTIDNFLSPEQCDALVEAASGSGLMRQSGVGGVPAGDGGSSGSGQEAYALPAGKDDIRTSSTLAATTDVGCVSPMHITRYTFWFGGLGVAGPS